MPEPDGDERALPLAQEILIPVNSDLCGTDADDPVPAVVVVLLEREAFLRSHRDAFDRGELSVLNLIQAQIAIPSSPKYARYRLCFPAGRFGEHNTKDDQSAAAEKSGIIAYFGKRTG